jgi:hypothetical protein
MKQSDAIARPRVTERKPKPRRERKSRKSRRLWRWVVLFFVLLIAVGGVARAIMPWALRGYVNRTLDRNPLYAGRIGTVRMHLWRGAYSIQDIRISKTSGNVPVPFFVAKQVEFALEWKGVWHRKLVGRVLLDEPELNFVDAPTEADTQTGAEGPWLEIVRDLFPFRINSAVVRNGSIHFRTYTAEIPVNVYLSQVEASVDNLGNILDETTPLVSTVQARARVMDEAKFEYRMTLDPFSYRPTFHMALRVLGLDVTKINDLAVTYGKFNFKRGWFDLVIESESKEGQLTGYVKPLFRNLRVFSLTRDLQEDNALQFFWQALVGATTTALKSQSRDQFGTLIPFRGDVSGSTTIDIFATIGNIFRNAFIRAYLPRLEGSEATERLHFEPPELTDPISAAADPDPLMLRDPVSKSL